MPETLRTTKILVCIMQWHGEVNHGRIFSGRIYISSNILIRRLILIPIRLATEVHLRLVSKPIQ